MHAIENFLNAIGGGIWGWPSYPMPAIAMVLIGTGVYLTIRLKLINVRGLWHAIRCVKGDFDDASSPGDISHFQALATALSGTVGVGNIAGVATAIHYGGPGALFWMWITALLGMATKYTECTLATNYRQTNSDGSVSGGPMYYIEHGLGPRWKWLAMIFAGAAAISSMNAANAVQAHTAADALHLEFGIAPWITGIASATLLALVTLGGIKRIASFTSRVIPLMAVLYVLGALLILSAHVTEIPATLALIVTQAFEPTAAIAGFAGATFIGTMNWGVKRGLYSNEAGQGSAPIAHAAARTDEPVREGLVALLEPAIDTLTICTLTGLVLICTGVWQGKRDDNVPVNAQSNIRAVTDTCQLGAGAALTPSCKLTAGTRYTLTDGIVSGVAFIRNDHFIDNARVHIDSVPANGHLVADDAWHFHLVNNHGTPITTAHIRGPHPRNGSPLTAWAFEVGLAWLFPFGAQLVTICVFLFALSTAIAWSYYGERSAHYLFGDRIVIPYRVVFIAMHVLGALSSLKVVWALGDAILGVMALPNLLAILLLSGKAAQLTRNYLGERAAY